MKRNAISGLPKNQRLITRRQALHAAGGLFGATLLAPSQGWARQDPNREVRRRRGRGRIQDALPTVARLIEDHGAQGGRGQLYVSIESETVVDVAWGDSPQGAPMREDSIVSWASAVKPSTCTCLMQQWEKGVVAHIGRVEGMDRAIYEDLALADL